MLLLGVISCRIEWMGNNNKIWKADIKGPASAAACRYSFDAFYIPSVYHCLKFSVNLWNSEQSDEYEFYRRPWIRHKLRNPHRTAPSDKQLLGHPFFELKVIQKQDHKLSGLWVNQNQRIYSKIYLLEIKIQKRC